MAFNWRQAEKVFNKVRANLKEAFDDIIHTEVKKLEEEQARAKTIGQVNKGLADRLSALEQAQIKAAEQTKLDVDQEAKQGIKMRSLEIERLEYNIAQLQREVETIIQLKENTLDKLAALEKQCQDKHIHEGFNKIKNLESEHDLSGVITDASKLDEVND